MKIPLHIALSYDEEVGCLGAPALIRSLPEGAARPRLAIIGEPTGMKLANAHKGIHSCAPGVTGHEGHSSARSRRQRDRRGGRDHRRDRPARRRMPSRRGAPTAGFDPPYTSFNVGRIAGGTAVNIIARDCAVDWEFRPVPGEDAAALRRRIDDFITADLLPRLRAGHPEAAVETETMASCRRSCPTRARRPRRSPAI